MNYRIKISFLLVVLLIVSCTDGASDMISPSTQEEPMQEVVPTNTVGTEQYVTENSKYIFDQDKLHTFELNLDPEDLAKIDADPSAEEYVEGNLTFEGETIMPIGIRYKGSIGAYVGCLSGGDWANPSGFKTCTKLSMKIKINYTDPEARFYGLKKLQFHSMNNDETQLRDRLGYWLFRKMDVPAPRAVHARLVINGQYMGLFSLVEQIDGRFTRYNFEDGTGNLYKEIWPLRDDGEPFPAEVYLDNLKTNEDENPSVEMIQTFAQEIEGASDAALPSVIEKWMDIEQTISYIVVDRTIRNDDGAFHWYCESDGCSSHNFYWYEEPTNRTLHLIPWDLDHAFINIIFDANPVTPIADEWGEITANCKPFGHGFLGVQQRSAACDKLTAGWITYQEEYLRLKQAFLDGPFAEDRVNEKIEEWSEQIRAATMEAASIHGDAVKEDIWERELITLKRQLQHARSKG